MSEPVKTDRLFVQLSESELASLIERAVERALANNGHPAEEKEKLLSAEETAALMGVKKEWLYRHSKHLPFTRKLSRKNIRFNEAGLKRWLAARK